MINAPNSGEKKVSEMVGMANEGEVIVDGQYKVTCLLDSGAQITTVSDVYYRDKLSHLDLIPLEEMFPDCQDGLKIESASGQHVPYLGCVALDMGFEEASAGCDYKQVVPVLVVPQTQYTAKVPFVIGTNILRECYNQCKGLHGTQLQKVKVSDGWRMAYQALRMSTRYENSEGTCGLAKLTSSKCVLPPGETTEVTAIVHTAGGGPELVAYTDWTTGNQLPPGVVLEPTLIQCSHQNSTARVPVILTNLTEEPVLLARHSVLCELQVVDEIVQEQKKIPTQVMHGSEILTEEAAPEEESLRYFKLQPDSEYHIDLRDSPISDGQCEEVRKVLRKWSHVFAKNSLDLGNSHIAQHEIHLTDHKPFREAHRRIPPHLLEEVREHLRKLLHMGVIRPSFSPWSSEMVFVRKKNGDLRLCTDWRKLNNRTIKDSFPLPRIEEIFDVLHGANLFCSLDLQLGYNQLDIKEEHKQFTAFSAGSLGFYEHNKMGYGLCNSPGTFQRAMIACLDGLHMRICIIFIDDILVFGCGFEEELERLEKVLSRLDANGFKLKPSKCHFFKPRVQYLGHVLSEQGIEPDPAKLSTVRDWPTPTCEAEVRSFVGFAGYYRRFVKGFSQIAKPLHDLLVGAPQTRSRNPKPSANWHWGDKEQQAFDTLKRRLTQEPVVLSFPKFDGDLFEVHIDASSEGLGAVLYQKDGKERRVVSYASRGLQAAEKNYPAHKLEFLALKWAVTEKFHEYLYGQKHFQVRTDNNPLTYVMTTAKLDATGHRWLQSLSNYNFEIVYKPGVSNVDADSLSRRPPGYDELKDVVRDEQWARDAQVCAGPSLKAMADMSVIDFEGYAGSIPAGVGAIPAPEPEPCDLNSWWGWQQKDPVVGRVMVLKSRAQRHPGSKPNTKTETPEVRRWLSHWKNLELKNGVLCHRIELDGEQHFQIVVPEAKRSEVLQALHDEMGHLGQDRTLDLVRRRYFWCDLRADVKDYVEKCGRCIRRKQLPRVATPLVNIQTSAPLELVCMDFLTVKPPSGGFSKILVITDHFTKYAIAVPTRNELAVTTAKALFDHFVVHYAFPLRLHSDQGRNFESKVIQQLCKLAGVEKSRTTPYHPQGDGQTERFNRTLLDMLGTLNDQRKSQWHKYVPALVHAYNCTRHSTTGYAPYFLMFGRHPTLAVDVALGSAQKESGKGAYVQELGERLKYAYDLVKQKTRQNAGRGKKHYDKKVKYASVAVGDRVLLRNMEPASKLDDRWEKEVYQVVSQPNPDIPVYVVEPVSGVGRQRVLHRNLLLPVPVLEEGVRLAQGKLPVSPDQQKPREKDSSKNMRTQTGQRERKEADQDEESSSDEEVVGRYHLRPRKKDHKPNQKLTRQNPGPRAPARSVNSGRTPKTPARSVDSGGTSVSQTGRGHGSELLDQSTPRSDPDSSRSTAPDSVSEESSYATGESLSSSLDSVREVEPARPATPYPGTGRIRRRPGRFDSYVVDFRPGKRKDRSVIVKGHVVREGEGSRRYTLYFGKESPLSNHHRCRIRIDDPAIPYQSFNCTEQYYMVKKCYAFGDENQAALVMDCRDAGAMKILCHGSKIKGFKSQVWGQQKRSIMELACQAKFRQNPHLKQSLLQTQGTVIAEACGDKFWGIGHNLDTKEAVVPSLWTGLNTMGKILTNLREQLS